MSVATEATSAPLALVTGASSGIGKSLVREFLERGYDVIAAAEDEAIRELADGSGRVSPVQVDLADPDGVAELYRVVEAAERPVEAAALNAGIGVGGRFDQTELEADLNLIDLNVRSTVHLAKLLSRDMVAQGGGRLLFTASIAATAPGPYQATYAASKAFVHFLAEGLRVELADSGVSVTSLMPGPTDTNFFSRADMEDTAIGQAHKDDPERVARDGIEALLAGKPHIVAGSFSNNVQANAAAHLPDSATSKLQARMAKPGSGA